MQANNAGISKMKSQGLRPVILRSEIRFTSRSYSRRSFVHIFKLCKIQCVKLSCFQKEKKQQKN